MSERDDWVVLAGVNGIGPRTFAALVGATGGAAAVLARARDGDWSWLPGGVYLSPETRTALTGAAFDREPFEREIERHGVWTLTALDADYPPRLQDLPDAPPVLFGWGARETLSASSAVAIVGTRRPTLLGRALASAVATRLAELGCVVVSGLAIGIDGGAHAATVAAAGRTVAVIGGGHREPGPRAHRALVREILACGGAVVSELSPLAPANRGTFPRRNRLLAALAAAVVVIEAPARSGALNTAHHALEQGRPLFVAPGRPGDRAVTGCLRLLRETEARPLVGLDELVEDLDGALPPAEQRGISPDSGLRMIGRARALAGLGPVERSVASAICAGPADLDRLVERTGLAPGAVAGALTLLQLRGWVRPLGAAFLADGALADR